MSIRRKAREYALQMLYQWEVSGKKPEQVEAGFWKSARSEKNTRTFANELFEGTAGWVAEIDKLLEQHAKNWRLDRMAHASELLDQIRASGFAFREVPVRIRYTAHSLRKGQSAREAIRIVFHYLLGRIFP